MKKIRRQKNKLTSVKVKVNIKNEQNEIKIPSGLRLLLRKTCTAVLRTENFTDPAEVNITFVNNDKIKELNEKFRNKNKVTDVLSFPLGENGEYDTNPETGNKMLGDVVISLLKAQEQAEEFGHSFEREVSYLTAHSVLHLLGYDHMTKLDRTKMRDKEKLVMTKLGLDIDLG